MILIVRMPLCERTGLISSLRVEVEKPIKKGLESIGFVKVEEDRETAIRLRVDTLKSVWALKGLNYMLEFEDEALSNNPEANDGRIERLASDLATHNWQQSGDVRYWGIIKRLVSVPSRNDLLMNTVISAHFNDSDAEEQKLARHRLTMMLDIIDGKIKEPAGNKRGVIFTQTAYLLGSVKKDISYGFDEWADFAFQLGGGALPYLGSAVVYAELMATGRFKEIKIGDFRDRQAIADVIAHKGDYDLVMVSGATTYDRQLIDGLNSRLAAEGMVVLNGGIAPTIDEDKERYLENGSSVFVGEFEGAADQVVSLLDYNPSPQIIIRNKDSGVARRLKRKGLVYTVLNGLEERVNMVEVYSVERERQGNLANRMEALEMMRPFAVYGGNLYEPPPSLRFHETVTSFGCPNSCIFCATVEPQGIDMRARTIPSIGQEWETVETTNIAIVDQNTTANGRTYVQELLELAEIMKKRLSFQAELLFFSPVSPGSGKEQYFFDGSENDEYLEDLLKRASLFIEVGIEQPAEVRGSQGGRKDPEKFAQALKRLNSLGLIVFETAIIGMPKELWADPGDEVDEVIIPYESKKNTILWEQMLDKWVDWFENRLPSPGVIPFAFTVIPGTSAYRLLKQLGRLRFEDDGMVRRKEKPSDLTPSLDPNVIIGIDSRQAIEDLRRRLYSMRSIIKRLRTAKYTPARFAFMLAFNLVLDLAFRDTME